MKTITLNTGDCAMVDDEDYARVSQYNWHLHDEGYVKHTKRRVVNGKVKWENIYLHRLVMNARRGKILDHINTNKLDNRKSNLRYATPTQNNCNQGKRSNNTSGHKGVHLEKARNKWYASISVNSRSIFLGRYDNIEDAAEAYAKASKKYHKEYGRVE